MCGVCVCVCGGVCGVWGVCVCVCVCVCGVCVIFLNTFKTHITFKKMSFLSKLSL